MKVVCTEKSQILGVRIADELGVPVADTRFSQFPDGELYLQVTGSLDDETIIVGSVTDNNALIQLMLLIDACETTTNTLVIPYLGYARQDKKFREGEPLSARVAARALSRGVSDIITVNIHEPEIARYFDAPAHDLSLAAEVGTYIGEQGLSDPLILAPDAGAAEFAGEIAAVGGWHADYLKKTRLSGEEVRMEPKSFEVRGREVVIVDDIISTGGTLATATGMLYEQGAAAVHAACVHGVFTGGAYVRLRAAGVKSLVCSDTIERACSSISAARTIAAALRKCS
ncbi:ribose-phosphate diphosphokinase [Methanofollis fontis]|uniref:Ribose-phosphate pyrophosphokinase n=1 Tax=Methanofollis fontis TaxID=2052832 RepID=A0A483CVR4_9EURY|nr:ribose-phosphate diphosphokinase [Methanofollis fontis]TAJ45776.1 ribose-phosphate diphosphokinase [Methanofollis fontis]